MALAELKSANRALKYGVLKIGQVRVLWPLGTQKSHRVIFFPRKMWFISDR